MISDYTGFVQKVVIAYQISINLLSSLTYKIGNWIHGIFAESAQCAQCGNYGNLLSRFFGKNFVKQTHLLNRLL